VEALLSKRFDREKEKEALRAKGKSSEKDIEAWETLVGGTTISSLRPLP
jgi:hypothetical protein